MFSQNDRQGGFELLKCCGKIIKPRRFTFTDDDGLKIMKIGKCNNPKCNITVIEVESVNLFGRVKSEILRGKKANKYLEENKYRLVEQKNHRQYKPNTAKGFHYSNSYWDLKKNKIRVERRELGTDRLISREDFDLIAV